MKWSWNLNDSISVFFFFKAFNESNSSSSESQDIEINACFEHIIDHIGHKTQFPRKRKLRHREKLSSYDFHEESPYLAYHDK